MRPPAFIRSLLAIVALALIPTIWLAVQPNYADRSLIDPDFPPQLSSSLEARGYVVVWLVTQVPPEMGRVPLSRRVFPKTLFVFYVVGFVISTLLDHPDPG